MSGNTFEVDGKPVTERELQMAERNYYHTGVRIGWCFDDDCTSLATQELMQKLALRSLASAQPDLGQGEMEIL